LTGMERESFVSWSFGHYLRIAHPSFAYAQSPTAPREPALAAAA
jgi:hypothetical protein